jgi:hypothetical protein
MKHSGNKRKYRGFADSPQSSGGGHEEKCNESAAQKCARDKDQSSPPSVNASHKTKSPLDCGGKLAGA